MKKVFFIFSLLVLGLGSSMATTEKAVENNLSEGELFCEAGWDDVEEYFDAGGDDGFYAGYLYCYHCPSEC